MGKKAREIVKVDVDDLINELKKAYADEWIAYFSYKWAADMAEGLKSPIVAELSDKIADEEEEHADELAERIIELGGTVPRDFEKLYELANCKKVNFPKDVRDLEGMLKALVEAEGCAIKVYNNFIKKLSPCYEKDIRTFHLIEHILSEEIEHEEAFENLL
ncbi:MAG: ferritin-like domain-containing protein [Candidatus Bathyarchaeota archaeon]|nr:ferritin-like domain-containing protein [Candidatus Bathyarchaeota archaeon]